ncbi:MAG: alpha/beta hydrolase, partial [Caulobacteraceae bacterium]
LAAWSADSGLLKPLSRSGIGDAIGLSGEAKKEKLWAFSSARHNRWAAAEVDEWGRTARQAREAGVFDRNLPVAVVLAGAGRRAARWKDHLAQPALAAQVGRVDRVKGANHASILGRRHADAVVEAIGWVRAARRP